MLTDFILSHVVRSICIIIVGIIAEIGIVVLDIRLHQAITGLTVAGITATCAACAVAFVHQHRLDGVVLRLLNREPPKKRTLMQRLEDRNGSVALLMPATITGGAAVGHIYAASEPPGWLLMAVGLAVVGGYIAFTRRKPRPNRKTRPGCLKRWRSWRAIRRAAAPSRLAEVRR